MLRYSQCRTLDNLHIWLVRMISVMTVIKVS